MTKKLNLNAIRIDGGTQSRVEINNEIVADYADGISAGIEFPPVVVVYDGADYWLADGFHRYHAHRRADKASIAAEVLNGTVRDAILYSLGANAAHGLHRTNADKRKAVETLIDDGEWAKWSDRKIAETCAVSVSFVGSVRRPEVAERQRENRGAHAEKVAAKRSPTTPAASAASAPAPAKAKREAQQKPAEVPDLTDADQLAEARDTLAQIAQENEHLRDRLAIEAMDASEDEKTQASETIAELREQVRILEIELDGVKSSRDAYMRENAELKKQVGAQRRELDRFKKVAA